MTEPTSVKTNFIRQIIDEDLRTGKCTQVATRFPPEPNGYLHLGHVKSVYLNFGIAEDYQGNCNLRFDDTNPHKESMQFVESIMEDVRWLGFYLGERIYYASDYFERLYEFALELIDQGLAYVDDLTSEEIREYRGTLTKPGRESPYRNRTPTENRDLFQRMRNGEYLSGTKVLRAKIDMESPNINLRDPVLYRIRHEVVHHQTKANWCLYPTYDYTHPLSDALEGISHSLCTLEFEDHRPLYDWVLEHIRVPHRPQQIEFARLNMEYTILSKRKLTQLVENGIVEDWDDPRMPTVAGLRRRGYTPTALRTFAHRIGVTKSDSIVELSMLENCLREDLDAHAPRRMVVLNPLKLIIDNYPKEQVEYLDAPNHPKDKTLGTRKLPYGREIYIDKADFCEQAPKNYKRLILGGEVRLRNSYVVRCDTIVKDDQGEIQELHCCYDPETLGKNPVGRKVKGVIHWVAASHAIPMEIRLYERLFATATLESSKNIPKNKNSKDNNSKDEDNPLIANLNPDSLIVLTQALGEPSLATTQPEARFQFEREGYFIRDKLFGPEGRPVFNRAVTLRDTWAKIKTP